MRMPRAVAWLRFLGAGSTERPSLAGGDASLGGIGGCPYARSAIGNVCSEEIVHALELMGYDGDFVYLFEQASRRCLSERPSSAVADLPKRQNHQIILD